MKPADQLRGMADRLANKLPLFGAEITTNKAAALLDECERMLDALEPGLRTLAATGVDAAVRMHAQSCATLAKLRGEA